MPEQNLKDKAVRGVGWSAADAFLGQGVTFIVGLILARLLSPEEYGLIGIITIFTTILAGFVDCGFSNSLIRKSNVSDDDYNTMFILNMVMSVAMCLLLFIGAPYIAVFFERPQLVALLRVMGLLLIFQALSIVQMTILSRKIDFKTKTKASIISAVTSGIAGIVMAFLGCGVWSLVAQQLSRQLVYSISLWIFNRWWPKLKFSIVSFRYMWGFGWKLMISGLLARIWDQLYQTVVGKFYTPSTLGQYTRAKEYASIFSSNLTSIVQRVSYPVLSNVQDDIPRMVSAYRRVIKTTMFVTANAMIALGAISEPLIYCLIGPQWHQAATFLPLICISLSLYPLHAINLNMLQVQGRTDVYLILEIIKKIIGLVPILIGIFVGIYWMVFSSIVIGVICFFLNSSYTGKLIGYSSWSQVKDVLPSYIIAFIVALSVFFIKYLPLSYWAILPIQLIVGIAVFFIINEIVKLSEYTELKVIVLGYWNKIIVKIKHKDGSEL